MSLATFKFDNWQEFACYQDSNYTRYQQSLRKKYSKPKKDKKENLKKLIFLSIKNRNKQIDLANLTKQKIKHLNNICFRAILKADTIIEKINTWCNSGLARYRFKNKLCIKHIIYKLEKVVEIWKKIDSSKITEITDTYIHSKLKRIIVKVKGNKHICLDDFKKILDLELEMLNILSDCRYIEKKHREHASEKKIFQQIIKKHNETFS